MIGVDLGMNVGSVIDVSPKGRVRNHLVLKFTEEKDIQNEFLRIRTIAIRFVDVILQMEKQPIAIEEPIFSWGRKNPKGFSKNVVLLTLVIEGLYQNKRRVKLINNKTAKRMAGGGGKDKAAMIQAYKKATGMLPGHSTKYGQETLADSYFIARAGQELR